MMVPKPVKLTKEEKMAIRIQKMKDRAKKKILEAREKKKREKYRNRPKAVHDRELAEWKKAVKDLAGWKCEVDGCGKTERLNAHHIFSVKNHTTRYYVPNGIALCPGHHTFNNQFSAHRTPMEFTEWIKEKRGIEWFEDLRRMAKKDSKGLIFNPYENELSVAQENTV